MFLTRIILVSLALVIAYSTFSLAENDTVKPEGESTTERCTDERDCEDVLYGCFGRCAVHKSAADTARKVLTGKHGDPSVMDCVSPEDLGDPDFNADFSKSPKSVCRAGDCEPGCTF
jgi:hypothetical protein